MGADFFNLVAAGLTLDLVIHAVSVVRATSAVLAKGAANCASGKWVTSTALDASPLKGIKRK
jgi:hypothetical protein